MKIKCVKIENFRNIKSLEFNVSNATVISGENELGKSNALNALVWFFTDTIYTDNSGVGENDINSICPKDQVKGEHTSVSVEFVDGPVFTKLYKTGYDRATGKANKHTTEGLINSVGCKNMQEWNTKLCEIVGFTPTFTSVKELNLYVDPLYALQKLDAKALRTLLVSFGCTATNEEMYELGYEDLRPYEKKYLGDFVNMRVDLKKQIKIINESVEKASILIGQYNSVQEFDNSKLDEINKTIDELNSKKASLKIGDNDSLVREYELKIKEVEMKLQSELDMKIHELEFKIKELESRKQFELDNIQASKENDTKELKLEINSLETEIRSAEISIKAYEQSLNTLRSNLATTQSAANNTVLKKSEYQAKLLAAKNRVFDGFIVCPCCGNSFATDESAEEDFKKHKEQDIEFYTNGINQFNNDITKFHEECRSIVDNANKTKHEISVLQNSVSENKIKLNSLNENLNQVISTPVDDSKLREIETQIEVLKNQLKSVKTTVPYNDSIANLKTKLDELKNNNEAALMEQVNDLYAKIDEAESIREDLYIERSNWQSKLKFQNDYDQAIKKLNDTESLLARVNDYIHSMIKLINDKAKEKTGMDFVMLEENLGNDGVKEVCYAVVDGVPFAMINTAKKYIYGIKFIEKVKDIAVNDFGKVRNDLPILADKFEGIDHIEKIKSLTSEQLICTRVGLEPNITIL